MRSRKLFRGPRGLMMGGQGALGGQGGHLGDPMGHRVSFVTYSPLPGSVQNILFICWFFLFENFVEMEKVGLDR